MSQIENSTLELSFFKNKTSFIYGQEKHLLDRASDEMSHSKLNKDLEE